MPSWPLGVLGICRIVLGVAIGLRVWTWPFSPAPSSASASSWPPSEPSVSSPLHSSQHIHNHCHWVAASTKAHSTSHSRLIFAFWQNCQLPAFEKRFVQMFCLLSRFFWSKLNEGLPKRLLGVMVLSDCDSDNFAAQFEVFGEGCFVGGVVDVFNKNWSFVWVFVGIAWLILLLILRCLLFRLLLIIWRLLNGSTCLVVCSCLVLGWIVVI